MMMRSLDEPISTRSGKSEISTQIIQEHSEDIHGKVAKKWIPLLSVRLLQVAFDRFCQMWKSRLSQVYIGIISRLFFWRSYDQEINTLQKQMVDLQRQIVTLHSALKQNRGAAESICMCLGNAADSRSSHPLPLPLSLGYGSSVDQLPILALAPLPPPPPPPPLPPPSTTVLQPFIPKKKAALATLQNTKENQDLVLAVTLRDIQSVKLKKVTTGNTEIANESSRQARAPLITVGDLQKVCLRRSHVLPLKRQISSTPTKNPLRLRSQLKRVQICRSPGGTPLFDKENIETGTGLTPIMTQALRRKFQRALPDRLPPKSNSINESFDGENVFAQNG